MTLRGRFDPLLLAVLATTGLMHLWVLGLPFQVDDYALLGRPWELFRISFEADGEEVPRFALRWPLWVLWGLLDAVLPRPLAPLPYHAVGLALHLVATGLVAVVARRLAPSAPRAAGLVAALTFGLAHGHAQAFSWTSAWGDLLMTVFALAGLRSLLVGRAEPDRGVASIGIWSFLALVAKTPAIVVPPVLAVWVLLLPGATGARRRRELSALAVALGAGLLCRWAYLGSALPRYGADEPPGLAEAPGVLAGGLAVLGQALVPWNRDPLFADVAPSLAPLLSGLTPLVAAAAALALLAAAAFGAAPAAWRAWVALGAAIVATVAPPGALYEGLLTNVVARVAYLPMAIFGVLAGCALAGLGRRGTAGRAVAGLAVVGLLAVHLDLGHHVRRTELVAAAERSQQLAVYADAAADLGPGDTLVLRWPPFGMGGIAQLGHFIERSQTVPFGSATPEGGPRVVKVVGEKQLLDALADSSASGGRLWLVDMEDAAATALDAAATALDDPASARAARRLTIEVPRGGEWSGRGPGGLSLAAPGEPGGPWSVAGPPLPGWGFAGIELELEGSDDATVRWIDGDGRPWPGGRLASGGRPDVRRVPLEAPRALGFRMGAGVGALDVRGPQVRSARLLPTLPRLTLAGDGLDGEVTLSSSAPPGPFEVRAPTDWTLPSTVRMTIAFESDQGLIEVFADAPFEPDSSGRATVALGLLHVDPTAPPGSASVPRAPWPAFHALLVPPGADGAIRRGAVTWSAALLHPDGGRAAVSAPISGRFRASVSGP